MRTLLAIVLPTLALQAHAQTTQVPAPTPVPTPAAQAPAVSIAQEVERLAPQLIAFSGSRANFEALVTGLALGVPVTLTTVGADGLVQTVRFNLPGGAQPSATHIAQTLEGARQQLISQGVATPNAQQLGELISGTTVPVAVGTLPPTVAPGAPGVPPGATGAAGGTAPSPAAQIQSRSIPDVPRTNTSDSRNLDATSASPLPPASGTLAPQAPPPTVTRSPALPVRPAPTPAR
jgi:hypothetical protein